MIDNNSTESTAKFTDGAISKTQHAADAANAFLRSGVDTVLHTSQQLSEGAQSATAKTVHYIQDEPIKAVLIAAATGAALMALVSMMSRSPVRA